MPIRPAANYRTKLEGIDEILQRSSLDDIEATKPSQRVAPKPKPTATHSTAGAPHSSVTPAAHFASASSAHKGCASVRALEITPADSPLEQWFYFIENFDQIKTPAKSTIVPRQENHHARYPRRHLHHTTPKSRLSSSSAENSSTKSKLTPATHKVAIRPNLP